MSFFKSIKTMGVAVTALASATIATQNAYADCEPEPYIGSICITAATFCPEPYRTLGGNQQVSIAQNQALFSVIQYTFGPYSNTYFSLPATSGRVLRSEGAGPGLISVFEGQVFGSTHVNMTDDHLPLHSHEAAYYPAGTGGAGLNVSTKNGTKATPSAGDYIAVSALGTTQSKSFISPSQAGQTVGLGGGVVIDAPDSQSIALSNTGSSSPIPVSPPQLALRFCIAMDGTYPQRP